MRRAWVLVGVVIALFVAPSVSGHTAALDPFAGRGASVSTTTVPTAGAPTTTALDNPFLSENANIGDCISAMPRPDCGSKARGGWRQTLVFAAVLLAMAVIGFRLFVAVRRRDRSAAHP